LIGAALKLVGDRLDRHPVAKFMAVFPDGRHVRGRSSAKREQGENPHFLRDAAEFQDGFLVKPRVEVI
jgi:hypothetical protein